MVTINLLPGREEWASYQDYVCKKIVGSVLLMVIGLLVLKYILLSQREVSLQKRITFLHGLIDKQKITNTKTTPSFARQHQSVAEIYFAERLFAALSSDIKHKNLCFSAIKRSASVVTFSGNSHSALELTEFLQTWRAADLFSEIQIKQLSQEKPGRIDFTFQGLIKNNKDV